MKEELGSLMGDVPHSCGMLGGEGAEQEEVERVEVSCRPPCAFWYSSTVFLSVRV
jgi:hypothetical protein